MVDGTGLENRHTLTGIGGSNPSLSASYNSPGPEFSPVILSISYASLDAFFRDGERIRNQRMQTSASMEELREAKAPAANFESVMPVMAMGIIVCRRSGANGVWRLMRLLVDGLRFSELYQHVNTTARLIGLANGSSFTSR